MALAGDRLGARAHHDCHARLGVGVAGFADGADAAVAQADVGLDDPPPIQDQGVSDHGVHGALAAGRLALAHAVADHLAAAKLHLIAIDGEILFHFQKQFGVGQAQPIAGGGAVGLGVGAAGDAVGHGNGGAGVAR